jgi:hypothetical protein
VTGRDRLPASLARRPDSARTAYRLAWSLVAGRGRADPGEAVRCARVAVAAEPANALYHSTLGAALNRAGRFLEAVDELQANFPRQARGVAPDSSGLDWLLLAMGRRWMGEPDAARAALAEALHCRAESPPFALTILLLPRFLREAESVLAELPPDLPANVFAR